MSIEHLPQQKAFLGGGGEMGQLTHEYDWASTPIGAIETWPPYLRTAVSLCLSSRFPIVIFWGPDFRQFYNDNYRSILGPHKHPQALGQRAQECWAEIWNVIGPMLNSVMTTGEATWSNDLLLQLERNVPVEECYFTFSYSAILDEDGEIAGVFCAVTETTGDVLGKRRLSLLQALATATTTASTAEEVCQRAATTIGEYAADLPFALLYLLDADDQQAHLSGNIGLSAGSKAAPLCITLASPDDRWSLGQVVQNGQPLLLSSLDECVGSFNGYNASQMPLPERALVLPLSKPGYPRPYGLLVAGLSPRRPVDEAYQSFCALVAGQISTALTSALAYQQERQRAEALAELDRAKTAFFSNVSHEFRTPLTLSLGPLEQVLSDRAHPLTEEQRRQLEMVHRNEQRQLKLVNTLLDFSRIEAGRADASYAPTDLAQLTRDLASAFRAAIEHAGLRLLIECAPLPEPIYVDHSMWEKIVLNLLSNAFKYTFEGEIRVTLQLVEGYVELIVQDTGVGISTQDVPHLFERFYRARPPQARTHEGSGIGLALVQELVRLHGGSITVQSQEGKGTTFTVRLPRGHAHLPAERLETPHALTSTALGTEAYVQEAWRWLPEVDVEREEQRQAATTHTPVTTFSANNPTQAPHLLIADDNADMREYLKRLLNPSYTVTLVADGSSVLEITRTVLPDLVISDIMMPGLDGLTLLKELRAMPATSAIPVILLSARAGEEATLEGLKAGANDYLVKPFSARELLARVEACLEIARLLEVAQTARAEREKLATELEVVFESMTDGVMVYDTQGNIVRTNRAVREVLAMDKINEYERLPLAARQHFFQPHNEHSAIITGDGLPIQRVLRGEILSGGRAVEMQQNTLDGRSIWVSVTGAPMRNQQQEIVGALLVMRDVTARRALEERTRRSLDALLQMAHALVEVTTNPGELLDESSWAGHIRSVMKQLTDLACLMLDCEWLGIVVVDEASGSLTPITTAGMEPTMEAIWQEETKHQRLQDIFTPDQLTQLSEGNVLFLHAHDLAKQMEERIRHYHIQTLFCAPLRAGTELIGLLSADYSGADHNFTEGELRMATAVATLVTLVLERERLLHERLEARQYEQELRTNERIAIESARARDEFIGIASHELRTPITVMKGNVQLARRFLKQLKQEITQEMPGLDKRTTIVAQLLESIERQTDLQSRLVSDLVDISRIQAKKLEIHPELVNVVTIVSDAIADQRLIAPERTITFASEVQEVMALADAARIGQVVGNYLSNALKYSPEESSVQVRLTVEETHVRVAVRDAGPGLSPKDQKHIWERFYRSSGAKDYTGGADLGLGLHISRSLIEQHGGQVGVVSALQEGSTFWFTLPVAQIADTSGETESA